MSEGYNIISLEVIDFKKIEAANVVFGEGLTKITGKNGAGKSSLIDAIFYALKPEGVDMPIHDSANRCVIRLNIGNDNRGFIIERTVTDSGKYLKVTDERNKSISSPQTFLNSLFSSMIDPEAFLRMKPKEQCEALRIACNCDTRALDDKYKEVYDERTVVNRRLDQAEKALIEIGDERPLVELKSVAELTNKLKEENAVVNQYDKLVESATAIKSHREANQLKIDETKAEIERLQAALDSLVKTDGEHLFQLSKMREECAVLIPRWKQAKEQIALIEVDVSTIDEHNKLANESAMINARRKELAETRNKEHTLSHQLNERLDAIKAEKKELLELADYPVDGMIVEGDSVYVNDVPLNDVNTAERIKIATFVAIAQNPQLKMIIIRNGSMLDDDSLKIIQDIADSKGYQIVMEKVSAESESGSIHIIEGKIQK